jgi:aminoglycoside 6'-N-acetyltransferase
MLLQLPTHLETARLLLRPYQPGDGGWYYAMSQKNRSHLSRYETDNVVMSIQSEQEAEILVRELAVEWAARNCFFLGAFERASGEFVAQIYVGPVNWDLPEFEIGYFADVNHEGLGFVTEAVQGALCFIFEHLQAHRVRIRCDDTNVRSGSVAERCGFVREGHLRENKKNPDGTFSGTLCYGLLKGEFEALDR